jgi:hypothetical protein
MSRRFLCLCLIFFYAAIFSALFALPVEEIPFPRQGASGLYGYSDATGEFVIKPQFDQAMPFTNGIARVKIRYHWRLINTKGKFINKSLYEEISDFRNGVAVVSKKESLASNKIVYGLINIKGTEIIEPRYDYLTPASDLSICMVGIKEQLPGKEETRIRFGVINASGKVVVPVAYQAIREYNFKLFAVKHINGTWQVYSTEGLPVFAGNYTDIKEFDERLAIIRQDGKWGILHRNGEMLVKPLYKNIIQKGAGSYELVNFTQWKVVSKKKEHLFSSSYDNLKPLDEGIFSYQYEGKYGLLNQKGEKISESLYDDIFPFVNDLACIKNETSYGVINKRGEVVLPARYQAVVIDSSTNIMKVKEADKWGIVSKAGKVITPFIYEEVNIQPYGLFAVKQGKQWYLLDATGRVAGSASYDDIKDFNGLYAVVKKQGQAGLINARGSWAIEPMYDSLQMMSPQTVLYYSGGGSGIINLFTRQTVFSAQSIEPLSSSLYKTSFEGKTGMYDYRGYMVISMEYDYISGVTRDSVLTVEKDDKKGLMSLQGKTILKPSQLYQELHVMREERAGVKINNKYGFIDRNGKLRIANRYEGIGSFSENMVAIRIRGKWGFIDKAEELRVQPIYEEVQDFRKGTAPVKMDGKWGFVNKTGRETVKPQYESIQLLPTGRYLVMKDGKKGLVTENGKELFIPKFDKVEDLGNDLILLGRNGKFGLSDINGLDVIPLIYDHLDVDSSKNIFILGGVPPSQTFDFRP